MPYEEEEDLRAEWFTWEWVRDVWIKRGLCDLERGNEIIAALEKEISDPHELLTLIGKERIAAMVRADYTPE